MWGVESNRVSYETPKLSSYFEEACLYQDFPDYPNGVMWDPASALMKKKGFRVILTGCGGDEWLTGSFYHYADLLRRLKIVTLIRQLRCDRQFDRNAAMVPAIVFPRGALLRVGFFPLLPRFAQRASKWLLRRRFAPPPWMDAQFARRSQLAERIEGKRPQRAFPTFAQEDMYRGLIDGWACQGNELGSRSEARFGLERRHPLSDRRVIEFAFALPGEQRWRADQPKRILRNAIPGLVPETIRLRLSKADFSHVFAESLKAIGQEGFFSSLRIASMGWIDSKRICSTHREMVASWEQSNGGLIPHAWTLWMSCGVEAWFRAAFEDARSPSADALDAPQLQAV
jgi:asparagine synthase (glutamine-hydrolysing)